MVQWKDVILVMLSIAEQLKDLRNKTLVAFGVVNAIWLVLIMTLVSKCQLNILGTNPIGT
jgi:hypothetical protein